MNLSSLQINLILWVQTVGVRDDQFSYDRVSKSAFESESEFSIDGKFWLQLSIAAFSNISWLPEHRPDLSSNPGAQLKHQFIVSYYNDTIRRNSTLKCPHYCRYQHLSTWTAWSFQRSLNKNVKKVKLSLCLTKRHAMKTYWGSGGIAPRIPGTKKNKLITFRVSHRYVVMGTMNTNGKSSRPTDRGNKKYVQTFVWNHHGKRQISRPRRTYV
jgi:hypothetical protein